MHRSIQLTLSLAAHFKTIMCQDRSHKIPGPLASQCWSKTKWLIIDEEGKRWTILHRRTAPDDVANDVIWYSDDMAPVDLGQLVAKKKAGEPVKESPKKSTAAADMKDPVGEVEETGDEMTQMEDEEWDLVEAEEISGGYVVVAEGSTSKR